MAWARRRRAADGTWRYIGYYRDPTGRQRSAGTYTTRHPGPRGPRPGDRVNPAEATDLPKVITRRRRIISPAEFDQLLAAIPERHHALVLTGIETGMRWGELAALRPRHLDQPDG